MLEQSSHGNVGVYDSDTFHWRSGTRNGLIPNESDEAALEFLHKHEGDVNRAEFHVATQVGSGAGEGLVGRRFAFAKRVGTLSCL